jgi:hypothetical protein
MIKHRMLVVVFRVAAAFVLSCAMSVGGQSSLSPVTRYFGATDGSAGVAVGDSYFVGATDENNVLRLYSATDGFKSRSLLDPDFGFPPNKKGKLREYDLEGATRIGSLIYFIGSHGRNGAGEVREERQVLFAAKVTGDGENTKLELVNNVPYKRLLTDLQGDETLSNLKLSDAIGEKKSDPTKAPKQPGALNMESICADHGKLLIGFRNPTIRQASEEDALVIPVLNPEAVVLGKESAKFGKPIFLDLGGRGIRDMALCRGEFLIIGGDYKDRFDSDAKPSRLFRWKGGEHDKPVDLGVDFGDLNPESIVIFGGGNDTRVLILSDDGEMKIDGRPNKERLESQQFFRGVWLQIQTQ